MLEIKSWIFKLCLKMRWLLMSCFIRICTICPPIPNFWTGNSLNETFVWHFADVNFVVRFFGTIRVKKVTSTLDISNTDISMYLLYHRIQFEHIQHFNTLPQTADISKWIFWDQKFYFEISVVWDELRHWDIESRLYNKCMLHPVFDW